MICCAFLSSRQSDLDRSSRRQRRFKRNRWYWKEGSKERGRKCFIFNDALNTFYLLLYGVGHMAKDHSDSERGNPRPHIGRRSYIYASSHRQDSTFDGLSYASRGALAGTRNSSMGPPLMIDPSTQRTMSECSYHRAASRSRWYWCSILSKSIQKEERKKKNMFYLTKHSTHFY